MWTASSPLKREVVTPLKIAMNFQDGATHLPAAALEPVASNHGNPSKDEDVTDDESDLTNISDDEFLDTEIEHIRCLHDAAEPRTRSL